jgi:hypothetical protein
MNSKPLLVMLVVISALNLGLTGWILIDLRSTTQLSSENRISPLPPELSASKRDAIFSQVENFYNKQDYDGLYAIFSHEVQVQIPKEQFIASMQQLKTTFGDIGEGAYSYYEAAGGRGGKSFYNLYYIVRLPKSVISSKGSLKITVVVGDGTVKLYGIYLSGITQ